eukprot:gene6309-4540_t
MHSENDDPYVADVNSILDTVRDKILDSRPANVYSFLFKVAKELQAHHENIETCSRIIPKFPEFLTERALTIVILGASGDLAKKKTFPALFHLYCDGLLPPHTRIVGYARTKMEDVEKWKHETLKSYFTRLNERGCHVEPFLKRVSYVAGSYTDVKDFEHLEKELQKVEKEFKGSDTEANRLFYLALPPTAFVDAATGIRHGTSAPGVRGWVRVVVEKPFGKDTETSAQLSHALEPLFDESQLFRIDHYLGKEMVQNILTTRFANHIFHSVWNAEHIQTVQITFKEKIGTEGRGGYFDNFGIIRDVIQNHLTQILALVAMEVPTSLDAEAIRNAKVAVLRCIEPASKELGCVLGQYTAAADGSMPGYLEDKTVPEGSRCPTFAMIRLHINNDRWRGVPFLIKAGKALEDKYVGVRIQFKDMVHPYGDASQRNELVIRAQPSESMYLKITAKTPGLQQDLRDTRQTELDLTYHSRYNVHLPDAYESLISAALAGNTTNFVRKDELDAAWRIFTPVLHQIDRGELDPIPYPAGTRGPKEADALLLDSGFLPSTDYQWNPPHHKL